VVEALQDLSVPLVAPTNQRTPVGAGVQENTHLAIATTHDEKGPTGHVAAPVVAWVFYLRLVAQVQPALVKNSLLLHLKNLQAMSLAERWTRKMPSLGLSIIRPLSSIMFTPLFLVFREFLNDQDRSRLHV